MKVLQINITVNVGSTGRIAEQIGLAVMERGGESYIAHGIDKAMSQSNVITIASRWNYRIHRNLSKWTDMQGRFSVLATKRLVQKNREDCTRHHPSAQHPRIVHQLQDSVRLSESSRCACGVDTPRLLAYDGPLRPFRIRTVREVEEWLPPLPRAEVIPGEQILRSLAQELHREARGVQFG
jgi:hypothetical protein